MIVAFDLCARAPSC